MNGSARPVGRTIILGLGLMCGASVAGASQSPTPGVGARTPVAGENSFAPALVPLAPTAGRPFNLEALRERTDLRWNLLARLAESQETPSSLFDPVSPIGETPTKTPPSTLVGSLSRPLVSVPGWRAEPLVEGPEFSDGPASSNPNNLTGTHVPEPASVILLLSGLSLMALMARNRLRRQLAH